MTRSNLSSLKGKLSTSDLRYLIDKSSFSFNSFAVFKNSSDISIYVTSKLMVANFLANKPTPVPKSSKVFPSMPNPFSFSLSNSSFG